METAVLVSQVVIALGIANVWLLRPARATPFRGGNATTMAEEFAVYGLSPAAMRAIGTAKLGLAAALFVGIWVPQLVQPAAIGMALLMVGAVAMHVKVGDSFAKSVPALAMLVLSSFVAVYG